MSREGYFEDVSLTYFYQKQRNPNFTWNRAQKEVASWPDYAARRAERRNKKLVNVRDLAHLSKAEREEFYPASDYEFYYE